MSVYDEFFDGPEVVDNHLVGNVKKPRKPKRVQYRKRIMALAERDGVDLGEELYEATLTLLARARDPDDKSGVAAFKTVTDRLCGIQQPARTQVNVNANATANAASSASGPPMPPLGEFADFLKELQGVVDEMPEQFRPKTIEGTARVIAQPIDPADEFL